MTKPLLDSPIMVSPVNFTNFLKCQIYKLKISNDITVWSRLSIIRIPPPHSNSTILFSLIEILFSFWLFSHELFSEDLFYENHI